MAPTGTSQPGMTPLISLIAGGAGGGIEATITYPFEYGKTLAQLRANKGVQVSQNPFLNVYNVFQKQGLRALYTGCTTLVIGTIGKDAIRFMSFDTIKRSFMDKETGKLSPLRSLAAGMSAGVVASTFAVTPTERIKTALIDDRRSSGPPRFTGAWHATKVLFKEHGIKGVYRGYISTTMKQAATTSTRMGTYEVMKQLSMSYDLPQNTAMSFFNGAVAGIVTTYATQPIDCIKTRAQSAKGAGIMEATKSIMLDYGIKGFWKGSTMRLGRTVFAGGILFTAYEQVSAILIPIMGAKV